MSTQRKGPSSSANGFNQPWIMGGSAVLAMAAVIWFVWGRGPNYASEAKELQQQILSLDTSPQDRKAMLSTVMRHVDKLDSNGQRRLIGSVWKEWRDVAKKDMDSFFAASQQEKNAALDTSLDRLEVIGDLQGAFFPGGMRVRRPRPQGDRPDKTRRPSSDARPKDGQKRPEKSKDSQERTRPTLSEADKLAMADRKKAFESYYSSLEKRAEERGMHFDSMKRRLMMVGWR